MWEQSVEKCRGVGLLGLVKRVGVGDESEEIGV